MFTRGTTLHIYVNLWVATSVHAEQTQDRMRLNDSKRLTKRAQHLDMIHRHQKSLIPKSDPKAPSCTSGPLVQLGTHVQFYELPVEVWNVIEHVVYMALLGTAYQISSQSSKIFLDNYATKVVLIKFYGFPISE